MEFFKTFYKDLIQVLTEPTRFFRERFQSLNLAQALAFGILVRWLAAGLEWLTRIVKHETLFDSFRQIQERLSSLPILKDVPDSIWNQSGSPASVASTSSLLEVGALLVSPFQSVATFCMSGVVLFLAGLLLVPRTPGDGRDSVEISRFIRLAAISAAPSLVGSILGFLPLNLGGTIGWVYHIAILSIGIALRYRISYFRAVSVIFLPGWVIVFAGSCVLGLAFALITKMGGTSPF